MKLRTATVFFCFLLLLLWSAPSFSQSEVSETVTEEEGESTEEPAEKEQSEDGEEESKELNFAGTPYVYTGPDTGFGAGFAIQFRDFLDKEGRDVSFGMTYTENLYQDFNITWSEPYFLSDQGRLEIRLKYQTRPAMRYYGIGNDTGPQDDCNWAYTGAEVEPTYIHRFPETEIGTIGLRGQLTYKYVDPDNGELDNPDAGSFNRKIKDVYPEMYYSDYFRPTELIIPTVTMYLDRREDRFPLGGGRETVVWPMKGQYFEVSYSRSDEAWGSDFTYNKTSVDARQFLPLFHEDTILAARVKAIISQGEVPFYEMPNYGGSSSVRGYYGYRFIDKNATQLNVEIRQGLFPDWKLELFDGKIKLKYPSVFLFWDEARVYDDYTEIPDKMWEDYHYAWGGGFRFVITPTVVIKLEWGNSDEQSTFYAGAGLPF
ncbi:MAG: BamA/TamA family outer membrane protein [bacterium]